MNTSKQTPMLHKAFDKTQSSYGSIIEKKVNPDLEEERKKIDFDQQELTNLIYGDEIDFHKAMVDALVKHPEIANTSSFHELTREESMERAMKIINTVYTNPDLFALFNRKSLTSSIADYLIGNFPYLISVSMFAMTINNLGTEEQVAKWSPPTAALRIHGCYAQTELGHGSFIQGIETTATLDTKTDEFVINSPHDSSAKYWPGELGKFANHTVLCARLMIDGQDFGPQFFFVPIRCTKTHEALPGIEIGDIGPKIAYNTKDNGFMLFHNYRIPRGNLLMKYCNVDKEGKVQLQGDPRILYAVMLGMRMWMVSVAWRFTAYGSMIAGRYSVCRRQFHTQENDNKKIERKLIDYQAHQFKLISILAQCYTQNIAQNILAAYYMDFVQTLYNGGTDFKPLKIIHHFSAGLKSYYSWGVNESLTKLRESCGGAGFSDFSGLPYLCKEYTAHVAFEGDNTVLLQQSARYIVAGVLKNKVFKFEFLKYLNNLPQQFSALPLKNSHGDIKCLKSIEEALRIRSAYAIYQSVVQGMARDKDAYTHKILMNEVYYQDQMVFIQHHMAYYTIWAARTHLERSNVKCPNLKKHLETLICIFGLTELQKDSAPLYDSGYFTQGHRQLINENLKTKITEIRPQYIPLVEAFNIPDSTLNSNIGNSFGDIYETQLNTARSSRYNQVDMMKGWGENILPIIQGKL